MENTPPQSWVDRTKSPFFQLSPVMLAQTLAESAPANLSDDQKIYRDALLYSTCRTGVNVMHEKARLKGELQARYQSPAAGIGRVGPEENKLYDLIDKGDAVAVARITKPQTMTFTTHPNFSRSRELVKLSKQLATTLGNLSMDEHDALLAKATGKAEPNDMPQGILEATQSKVKETVDLIHENLALRTKRARYDELKETTLDMIPTVMDAVAEHIEIYKKRKEAVWLPEVSKKEFADNSEEEEAKRVNYVEELKNLAKSQNKELSDLTDEEIKPIRAKYVKPLNFSSQQPVKPSPGFSSVAQLDAAAELLPEFNSWFLDGDGKRTVHVWDAEVAVPAVKRATYAEYLKLLEKLPDVLGGQNLKAERERLIAVNKVLEEAETLTAARMDAYNTLHDLAHKEKSGRKESDESYQKALKAAQSASEAYYQFKKKAVTLSEGVPPISVIELLKEDSAAHLKNTLSTALNKYYSDSSLHNESGAAQLAETLYMGVKKYGNFAIHMQRRENAVQYKSAFEYLVGNLDNSQKETLANQASLDVSQLLEKENQSNVIAAFAALIQNPADPLHIKDEKGFLKEYTTLHDKLETSWVKQGNGENPHVAMNALTKDELLALDDLGMFRMASLYPEAFKGGFVIAEYGQPDYEFLRKNVINPDDSDDVKQKKEKALAAEVSRIAKDDMLLQIAFASAMGAPNVEIIPLHEDPSTMTYAKDAVATLRDDPIIRDYYLNWLGVKDNPALAAEKSVKYLDDTGKPAPMDAYHYLLRAGATDEELQKILRDTESKNGLPAESLNINLFKAMHVLEGPHDMEACSDNNKRAGVLGSVLADQSVHDKMIAAAIHTVLKPISIDGQNYLIVKPKYLGQGGSLARAVEIPLDTGQSTWQGEHTSNFTPASLAHQAYNFLMGRLNLHQEAARGETPSEALSEIAAKFPHVANALGLKSYAIMDDERRQMLMSIESRLASTRDDVTFKINTGTPEEEDVTRYDLFLRRYGEPVSNFSARPGSKGKANFIEGRAIGIAGNESGIFSNSIAFAEMFTDQPGEEKGSALRGLKEWRKKDPMIQQLITGASLTANFVNLEEKWKRGDVGFELIKGNDGQYIPILSKEGKAVPLSKLTQAYDDGKTSYAEKGITFGPADLVMAHLTDQHLRMVEGLKKLHGKTEIIDFLPKEHQADVKYLADLNTKILTRWHETKEQREGAEAAKKEGLTPNPEDAKAGKLALDAYYLLHESGSVYPLPMLLEKRLFEEAGKAQPALAA